MLCGFILPATQPAASVWIQRRLQVRWTGRLLCLLAAVAVAGADASATADAAVGADPETEDRILYFDSEIRIEADASVTVTETIRVRAAGERISHGIYRDIPTRYPDRVRSRASARVDVLAVARNGYAEPWRIEMLDDVARIRLGADAGVGAGLHEYVLSYRTDRRIGHFDAHDELYWNVTGNHWQLPIEQAGATVTLPLAIPEVELMVEGYTGVRGATGQAFVSERRPGLVRFETTEALEPGEGFTIVVGWPKGIVAEPGLWTRVRYFLEDNVGVLLAGLTLALVCGYLFLAWYRYGRDPAAGATFAHYLPPEGYSPGAVRYISRMGYDIRTLASALVSLAVRGHLKIGHDGDAYQLVQGSSSQRLGPGEAALKQQLFSASPVLDLSRGEHERIDAARRAHRNELRRHYYRVYFRNNAAWLLPALAGTALAALVITVLGAFSPLVSLIFAVNLAVQAFALLLMKAPTRRGRLLLDQLAGFELYLTVAEKDDLNRRLAPVLNGELFERYLPFAIALGVESRWADKFAGVLAEQNIAERTAYQPGWYLGDFYPHQLDRFVDEVGSSLSDAVARAATPRRPGGRAPSAGGGG